MARNESFFKRLTKLFRSGPSIQRRVKGQNVGSYYDTKLVQGNYGYRAPAPFGFGRENSPFSVLGSYGILDRMARYAEFCFAPETLIYTTRGVFTIKELSEKYSNGERFQVYSFDHNLNEIVIADAHHPRITKDAKPQEVVRVEFDDGGFVVTTLDHKFLLRDGTYVEAKDLTPNVALMPFHSKDITASGYKHIYTINRETNKYGWTSEHVLVAENTAGRKLKQGEVVHHRDFNPSNNLPENLEIMDELAHKRYHSLLNNRNKFGKPNTKHSLWMKQNNPVKRTDVTFDTIYDTASKLNFSLAQTKKALHCDQNVIKRRLREAGFTNWLDFKEYRGELTLIKNATTIMKEMVSPTIEVIVEKSVGATTIYEVASKIGCTENAIRRRLKAHKMGTWTEFRKKHLQPNTPEFSPGDISKNSEFDESVTYQDICSIYTPGMSAAEIAKSLGTTINKVKTRVVRQGYDSFGHWKQSYKNHKVASVEFLSEKSPVYNLTVDGHHNVAVGSELLNPVMSKDGKSTSRKYSMVICRQSEMEYCLHPDTKIAVPGGYKTIKELSDECAENPDHTFIIYSYDHSKKMITPAVGRQARQTRVDHAYKVTFNSGKEIIGTSNHRLMKRDGTYCEIGDLKPGDAMMPFYRKDLFSENKSDDGDGYRWIYTMNKERSTRNNGWEAEHRVIAAWAAQREIASDEVVHHRNFVKYDNQIENLQIMTKKAHDHYHMEIINGKKWDYEVNSEWIENFKKQHSAWMRENNPAERKDITFERILHWCDTNSFNLYKASKAFDTDNNTIKRKLNSKGFDTWMEFAKAYSPGWRSESWNNLGDKNPRFRSDITFGKICNLYTKGTTKKHLAKQLGVSVVPIQNRLKEAGYNTWTEFVNSYENHKVVSVEYYGKIPLYDLTVDGYKNFATDSVVSHNTPEIATAIDIYADETAGGDDHGHSLHIYSDNIQIKRALEELYYDVLNVEFNLRSWTRNLCKYGDFFLYNEVLPDVGVINAQPIPVNELEREEGYDEEDPYAVRFKWLTRGNIYLENWQVTHMRILGNDLFLPYGTAILEPARRIWRQLIMMEDAMLVYRVVRSPERRVFYIDVGNIAPNDVPSYMEAAKSTLRSHSVIDRTTGRQDLRYNPLAVDEDYYIPVRGGQSGTKIDTLAGGTHVTATEDVAYIQSKLFAALKVPKPYLNYDENLSSKATLAQEDVRFSRTIGNIQKIVVSELTKLAMIHLFAKGFDGEDLIDFEVKLSNPSTIALQQKLELWSTKMDIAGTAKETGLVDSLWIQKNILELTEDDINGINKGIYQDKVTEVQLDKVAFEEEEEKQTTTDPFSSSNYKMPGENIPKGPPSSNDNGKKKESGTDIVIPSGGKKKDKFKVDYSQGSSPIKASPFLTRNKRNRKRTVGAGGRANTANPDFSGMLTPGKNRSLTDIYDKGFLRKPTKREGLEFDAEGEVITLGEETQKIKLGASFTKEMQSIFFGMREHLHINEEETVGKVLKEDFEIDFEITGNEHDFLLEEVLTDEAEEENNEENDVKIDFNNKKSLKETLEFEDENTKKKTIEPEIE